MPEVRHGEQLPTHSVVMPYEKTLGGEAVKLYNKSRRKAMPWQEQQIYDIMAVDDSGLWLHMKYGYSLPRRNGKSEILVMRIQWGLTHGEKILYTAHRTSTSSDMWTRVVEALTACGYVEKQDFKTIKSHGFEKIEMFESGGSLSTRTRSSKSGLGEGFDLLVIDEAQEYTADQQSALQYLVTSSQNPQTIMCGTPPTAVSAGTVFPKYRRKTLQGDNTNAGWAEWSLPKMSDMSDRDLWYKTNPSLGYTLTERNIADEDFDDNVDANIQRLGVWILYKQNSAITLAEWNICKGDKPKLKSPPQLFFGISYAKASDNISIAVACRTDSGCTNGVGTIFVEGIDCYPSRAGVGAILPYLRSAHCAGVAIDGANGYAILTDEMKNAGIKKPPVIPKVAEVIAANSLFEQQIFAGLIIHAGQPALTQAVTNCEHRPIGSSGGFGYNTLLEEADVGLVEAVSLAHWLCYNTKEKKVQKCYYY